MTTDPARTRMPELARKAGKLARQNRDLRKALLDSQWEAAKANKLLHQAANDAIDDDWLRDARGHLEAGAVDARVTRATPTQSDEPQMELGPPRPQQETGSDSLGRTQAPGPGTGKTDVAVGAGASNPQHAPATQPDYPLGNPEALQEPAIPSDAVSEEDLCREFEDGWNPGPKETARLREKCNRLIAEVRRSRKELNDSTAYCSGEWPCEASTAAASLELERNELRSQLKDARKALEELVAMGHVPLWIQDKITTTLAKIGGGG